MRAMALTALALAGFALPLSAQGSGAGDGIRFGITFGGISTVGLVVELFDDARSYELGLGTFDYRGLAVSAVVKEYFGAGALRPHVGAGLWVVTAWPPQERLGVALVLRAPIGVDWSIAEDHAVGAVLNVNRALWVRRSDPEDDLPMNNRLVPLPGVYYRLTR